MVLVHEPVCIYMCDVLCAFERNCDLILLLADVRDTCASLPALFPHLIQAITKSTVSFKLGFNSGIRELIYAQFYAWAQFRGGHGGRVPPTFSDGGT